MSEWIISQLEKNRLLQNREEVLAFDAALEELDRLPRSDEIHFVALSVLDDSTSHPEVMSGLMHYLETFEVSTFVRALARLPSSTETRSEEWVGLMFTRACNDSNTMNSVADVINKLSDQERARILDWIQSNPYIRPEYKTAFQQ